jgi:aspartate aminotransferase-like enzyme
LSIVFVSPKAWKVIEEVKYPGYDAVLPWKHAAEKKYFPYTPNWHAIAALDVSLKALLKEGLENVARRHDDVAKYCRFVYFIYNLIDWLGIDYVQ